MSVAKGSSEEPWLLELHYNCPNVGKEEREGREIGKGKPTVLVGKGANDPKFSLEKIFAVMLLTCGIFSS